MPPEALQAQRSVVLRLEALEQRGITPTYEHYGLEQHFDLERRRRRTYPPRTRLPSEDAGKHEDEAKVNNRQARGMSRTRAHMYHGIRHRTRPNLPEARSSSPVQLLDVEGLEHKESEDHDSDVFIDYGEDDSEDDQRKPAAAGTVVVAVKEADPPPMAVVVTPRSTFHQLRLNAAEGTSLEDTSVDNCKGIRHWLNVTKLYNPFFAVMHQWLYGRENRQPQWRPTSSSANSWQQWLNRNGAEGTAEELRRVARDLKNAMQLNRYNYHDQRVREGDGVPYTVAKARLLSHAEYRAAEGNPATPLMGDDRFFD